MARSERRLTTLSDDEEKMLDYLDDLREKIERLEAQETELSNAVHLSGDGAVNFEVAMNEVAGATSAAADMSLTNDLLQAAQKRAFNDDQGNVRRFAIDDTQCGTVHCGGLPESG